MEICHQYHRHALRVIHIQGVGEVRGTLSIQVIKRLGFKQQLNVTTNKHVIARLAKMESSAHLPPTHIITQFLKSSHAAISYCDICKRFEAWLKSDNCRT